VERPEDELRRLGKENRKLEARCEMLKNGGHLEQPVVDAQGGDSAK
jgi:hypothetical protein